jgi:hypothetical protein
MPSIWDAAKQYLRDASPGGALSPEVSRQGLLDTAALSTAPVPLLGDALGLLADANRYATDPSSRTPGNFALSGLGLLPFVPGMTAVRAGISPDYTKWGVRASEARDMGEGSKMVEFLSADGRPIGNMVFRETPEQFIIDGLQGVRTRGSPDKGMASKAVKAAIEQAIPAGKSVLATNIGGAIPYWMGTMGFRRSGHNAVMDAEQLAKIKSGDITSVGWPHPRGYGDLFLERFGPMIP